MLFEATNTGTLIPVFHNFLYAGTSTSTGANKISGIRYARRTKCITHGKNAYEVGRLFFNGQHLRAILRIF